MQELVFRPSDFVAVLNQTLEFAYPSVEIEGELTNFRISKNKWVYFDLKDEHASVKFFGTVYALPGPLEDGMMLRVLGQPRLSPRYGFSINVRSIRPVGEGSLVKAAKLLEAKLQKEGLFDTERKRAVPYPPQHIGLITSGQSAAYADFMKILNARWGGLTISHVDVQVQGEQAVTDIVQAFETFNTHASPPDVIVLTRGGGSIDDLAAFSTEQVARAVASSRVPTVVGVGHEVDTSLAELAADKRASTPSNVAEMLVPDRQAELSHLHRAQESMTAHVRSRLDDIKVNAKQSKEQLLMLLTRIYSQAHQTLQAQSTLLEQLHPQTVLNRGYAIVRKGTQTIQSVSEAHTGDNVNIKLRDGSLDATIKSIHKKDI